MASLQNVSDENRKSNKKIRGEGNYEQEKRIKIREKKICVIVKNIIKTNKQKKTLKGRNNHKAFVVWR